MKVAADPKAVFWRAVFWLCLSVLWLALSVGRYDRAISRHEPGTLKLVGIWFWVMMLLFWIYGLVTSWRALRAERPAKELT